MQLYLVYSYSHLFSIFDNSLQLCYNFFDCGVNLLNILTGNPKKIFKIIYKRYKSNNPINADEISTLFSNQVELEEDLTYLHTLNLIDHDYTWKYFLTPKGRIYYKELFIHLFLAITKSIVFPIIVAFITTLITLWLKG